MAQEDLYATLGVTPDADMKAVKSAYRRLAFKHHPDRNRDDPSAAEAMKRLNEAYAVLSDAGKRREYDELRRQFGANAYERFRTRHSEQDIFSGSDINSVFEEMARMFGFRGVDDIFRDFYGQDYQRFEFKPRRATVRTFIFRRPVRTEAGGRAGTLSPGPGGALLRFLVRKLTGIELPAEGEDIRDRIFLEPRLAAGGGPYAYEHRRRQKKLIVSIPKGVREGQTIRLAGMGTPGRAGGKDGDLLLEVRLRKPFFSAAVEFLYRLLGRGTGRNP
jgi:DnaJ-class molecular chaperone